MQRTLVCQGGWKKPQRLPGGMLVGLGQCWIVLDGSHLGRAVPAAGVQLHMGTEELRAKTHATLSFHLTKQKDHLFSQSKLCSASDCDLDSQCQNPGLVFTTWP